MSSYCLLALQSRADQIRSKYLHLKLVLLFVVQRLLEHHLQLRAPVHLLRDLQLKLGHVRGQAVLLDAVAGAVGILSSRHYEAAANQGGLQDLVLHCVLRELWPVVVDVNHLHFHLDDLKELHRLYRHVKYYSALRLPDKNKRA